MVGKEKERHSRQIQEVMKKQKRKKDYVIVREKSLKQHVNMQDSGENRAHDVSMIG